MCRTIVVCRAGDVESQYTTAGEGSTAFGETRSLREKYASGSSLDRGASSQGTYADPMRSLRQSQESLMRGSQEAFKHMGASAGPLAASMAAAQLTGGRGGSPPAPLPMHGAGGVQVPVASATPGLADTQPLRRSLTSSGNNSSADASQNTGGGGGAGGSLQRSIWCPRLVPPPCLPAFVSTCPSWATASMATAQR